jgi:2-dehydro-3-deoxyphosphogluconate aldolase/(4S)-4-hydroxy-2-oxoglutarate aldolase
VFRTSEIKNVIPASKAIYEGGIGTVEYTMTMPKALELVKQAVAELPKDMFVGAGTIVDAKTVDLAVEAGAKFIASPGIAPEMVKACVKNGVVSVVGATTPTEIMNALDLGADVIKVFCAAAVGPVFFENMPGPFPGICMMAAGGMTLANLGDYIRAGAQIVTYVPNLSDPQAYLEGDYPKLTQTAKKYVDAVKVARQPK